VNLIGSNNGKRHDKTSRPMTIQRDQRLQPKGPDANVDIVRRCRRPKCREINSRKICRQSEIGARRDALLFQFIREQEIPKQWLSNIPPLALIMKFFDSIDGRSKVVCTLYELARATKTNSDISPLVAGETLSRIGNNGDPVRSLQQ